jgi:hypothetical protein
VWSDSYHGANDGSAFGGGAARAVPATATASKSGKARGTFTPPVPLSNSNASICSFPQEVGTLALQRARPVRKGQIHRHGAGSRCAFDAVCHSGQSGHLARMMSIAKSPLFRGKGSRVCRLCFPTSRLPLLENQTGHYWQSVNKPIRRSNLHGARPPKRAPFLSPAWAQIRRPGRPCARPEPGAARTH